MTVAAAGYRFPNERVRFAVDALSNLNNNNIMFLIFTFQIEFRFYGQLIFFFHRSKTKLYQL